MRFRKISLTMILPIPIERIRWEFLHILVPLLLIQTDRSRFHSHVVNVSTSNCSVYPISIGPSESGSTASLLLVMACLDSSFPTYDNFHFVQCAWAVLGDPCHVFFYRFAFTVPMLRQCFFNLGMRTIPRGPTYCHKKGGWDVYFFETP